MSDQFRAGNPIGQTVSDIGNAPRDRQEGRITTHPHHAPDCLKPSPNRLQRRRRSTPRIDGSPGFRGFREFRGACWLICWRTTMARTGKGKRGWMWDGPRSAPIFLLRQSHRRFPAASRLHATSAMRLKASAASSCRPGPRVSAVFVRLQSAVGVVAGTGLQQMLARCRCIFTSAARIF